MKTTAQAGPTSPAAGPTGRLAELLNTIRLQGGPWTTSRAVRLYRRLPSTAGIPDTRIRAVARGDLRDLCAWGHLLRHKEPGRQYYTLTTRKDER